MKRGASMKIRARVGTGPSIVPLLRQAVGCSLSHSRRASFIRVCHPRPNERKDATISASNRTVVTTLVTSFGGRPRDFRYASTISGTTSDAGRIRFSISSVNSGESTASQSSCLMWSGFRFVFIIFPFPVVGFSQADDPAILTSSCINQDVQPGVDKSKSNSSRFSVIFPVIFNVDRRFPIESFRKGKVDAVLGDIGLSFEVVPFDYHRLIVHTIMKEINSEGATPGLPKERLTGPLPIVCPRQNGVPPCQS